MKEEALDRNWRSWIYLLVGWLAILAVVLGSAVVFLVAAGWVDPGRLLGDWALGHELLDFAQRAEGPRQLWVAGGALLIGVLALVLLLYPRSPLRRGSASMHLLSMDERGFVVVDSQGIASVAAQAAASVQGVLEADADVRGTGMSPVRLQVLVGVLPGTGVKQIGDQVREAVREAVETLVGVQVRDVSARVEILEPEALHRVLQ